MTTDHPVARGSDPAAVPLLFLAHTGQRSGAEKVLLDVVAEALDRGHQVSLACPDGPLAEGLPPGVERVRVPRLGLSGETGIARVLALARLGISWVRAGAIVRSRVRRSPGTRVVVNSLMATPVLRVAGVRGSWLVHDTVSSGKQRAALKVAGPAIRVAVAVSELTAEALSETVIPTVVRHNGIALPAADASHARGEPPVVGMLAALTPWKGHRLLLEAAARLPWVRVELTGTGFPGEEWYAEELRERASRPDLAGRVEFLGHVRPDEVLGRWDIAVNCSELHEAGPISVLELLAAGIPVVVSPRTSYLFPGVCVEVRPDDPAALADGIAEVLAWDDTTRANRVAEGRRRVADGHDLDRTVPRMLDALIAVPPPER